MSQIQVFDPQRAALPAHLVEVVNISDVVVRFQIDSYPGSPSTTFALRPGERCALPRTFCAPIVSANPERGRESILHMKTAMDPYPGAIQQLQTVVPADHAEEAAAAWQAAKRARPASRTVVLADTQGNKIPVQIPNPDEAPDAEEAAPLSVAPEAPRAAPVVTAPPADKPARSTKAQDK